MNTPVACVEIFSRFWLALLGEIDTSVAKVTTNVWLLSPQMDSLDPDFTVEDNLFVYGVACQSSRVKLVVFNMNNFCKLRTICRNDKGYSI